MPEERRTCSECEEESAEYGDLCEGCAYGCVECDALFSNSGSLDNYSRCLHCTLTCRDCGACIEGEDEWGRGLCCTQECEDCSETFNNESYTICPSCRIPADEPSSGTIQEYDYLPEIQYFHRVRAPIGRQPRSGLYMGVEVEMECVGDYDCETVAERLAFPSDSPWYIKSDGSLVSGIEVVSHPIDVERWRTCEDMGWMEDAQRMGCRAYDTETCGLHVHVGRSQFTKMQLWKILTLLAANSDWAVAISRRRSASTYAVHDCLEDFMDASDLADKALSISRGVRYSAVNVNNSRTIEFRLFRGTLSKVGLLRNLDWVACLIGYARSASVRNLSVENFNSWIRSPASERYISRTSAFVVANWSEEKMQCV